MDSAAAPAHPMAGRRLTGPRRLVLEALRQLPGPFTVEDIHRATPGIGRATVFRTTKLLQEIGILCRLQLEDGSIRYQLSNGAHHHHLVCGKCGSITDFNDRELDEMIVRKAAGTGFRIEGHSLEIYGLCKRCQG